MCGIAGRILSRSGKVGADLVTLMDAQVHRGADSTGFALYGKPLAKGFIVRAVGTDRARLAKDLAEFRAILKANKSDFLKDPTWDDATSKHVSVRMIIKEPKNLADWCVEADGMAANLEIQSVGRSLEIVKDLGGANDVDAKHDVSSFVGTHGLGHARLATESAVHPTASHPFWARPFPDVAIVHNGQITDYYTWRDKLVRRGYRFMTWNDSELLAVWISDQMRQGLSKAKALEKSISSIDGVFTFMISDIDGIGYAKDRFAMKPLVSVEMPNGDMAVATEEQAVRTVYTDEVEVKNYDGPRLHGIWPVGSDLRKAA